MSRRSAIRASRSRVDTARPSTMTSPASGCNNPTTCFRATLLPVPEYPMMTTVSWSGTVRVKPASTGFAPKLLCRSWNWITAATPAPRTHPARATARPSRRPRGWCSALRPPRRRAPGEHGAELQHHRFPDQGADEVERDGISEGVRRLEGEYDAGKRGDEQGDGKGVHTDPPQLDERQPPPDVHVGNGARQVPHEMSEAADDLNGGDGPSADPLDHGLKVQFQATRRQAASG